MKDVSLDVAAQHNDDFTRRIKLHFACVSDCEYHVRCYNHGNMFMKIPKYADLPMLCHSSCISIIYFRASTLPVGKSAYLGIFMNLL